MHSALRRIPMGIGALLLLACSGDDRGNLNHTLVFDGDHKLVSWIQPQNLAYDGVIRRSADYFALGVPIAPNGLPTYYSYSCMDEAGVAGLAWPHNPAGLNAMMVDSAIAYYAYSGDHRLADAVGGMLDHQLAHGTTPATYAWAQVPWSSAEPGSLDYAGAAPGDAPGVLEVDKIGELGLGYLKWSRFTGKAVYLDAAIHCADALAAHVRPGTADQSPWPFRVAAQDGAVLEDYTSAVIASIRLFDELIRLGQGQVATYQSARDLAWAWLMAYPMKNQQWSGYFEDIAIHATHDNYNQYSPMETARYLLEHPTADPAWKTDVPALIAWVEATLVHQSVKDEPGVQWGANTVSEQLADQNRMASHTARYASVNAMWAEAAGDADAQEKAFRSFNWATYMCRDNGVVNVGPKDTHVWFTDGYGDYIRHFIAGMAAVPAWAPDGQNHLLRSSSIATSVSYAAGEVDYLAADASGQEVLKLAFTPSQLWMDGVLTAPQTDPSVQGWSFDAASRVLRVTRTGASSIRVTGP
jgi:hypothetical protein